MAVDKDSVPEHIAAESMRSPNSIARDAEEAAHLDARERDIITLTARDSLAFARSLLDPPDPNDALVRAFQRHAALIGDE